MDQATLQGLTERRHSSHYSDAMSYSTTNRNRIPGESRALMSGMSLGGLDVFIALYISLIVTPAAIATALTSVEIAELLSGEVQVAYYPALVVLCLHVVTGFLVTALSSHPTAVPMTSLLHAVDLVVAILKRLVISFFTWAGQLIHVQVQESRKTPAPCHSSRPITRWTPSVHPQLLYE